MKRYASQNVIKSAPVKSITLYHQRRVHLFMPLFAERSDRLTNEIAIPVCSILCISLNVYCGLFCLCIYFMYDYKAPRMVILIVLYCMNIRVYTRIVIKPSTVAECYELVHWQNNAVRKCMFSFVFLMDTRASIQMYKQGVHTNVV